MNYWIGDRSVHYTLWRKCINCSSKHRRWTHVLVKDKQYMRFVRNSPSCPLIRRTPLCVKKKTLIKALLQTTEGVDTLSILFMRTSQHRNKNVNPHNRTKYWTPLYAIKYTKYNKTRTLLQTTWSKDELIFVFMRTS